MREDVKQGYKVEELITIRALGVKALEEPK